ncbi:FAD-binding oxidoreductase [Shinella curvata]|uniref:FAD-binding oxidoreductase n=1 Tax=Shinella curvata TaxID=1817964 RepID=A0ABT8XA19_9HYPH|nr:FAD-binding oxidoreductase [Shinella curvata]MCJ8051764.1 FAD-binding oxidoreductase [Shinella curvata]MDO6120288.1 FAD-binding oxidoreductase [Shinella curvata]
MLRSRPISTPRDITRQRDLHESRPLWAGSSRLSLRLHRKPSASDYDVIIVGAGISGALMAHALADGKRRILVIDRRKPVHGSTLASTAMIQHEIDIPLHKLADMIGQGNARRAWQRSARAVEQLSRIVADLKISCGFERKKTLFLAGDTYGQRALRAEVEARRAAAIDAEFLDGHALADRFAIHRTGAILSDISASANPARMAAGILRAAMAHGVELVSPLEITDVRATPAGGVFLATSEGGILSAAHAVFCSGYEFLEAVADKNHAIVSTWALSTPPGTKLPDWLKDCIVWEGADPYLYLRRTRDGRLIVGGEDEDSEDAYKSRSKLRQKARIIRRKAETLLGTALPEPDHVWAAPFGITRTGLPLIGRVPNLPDVFAVMGFGGNGITFSQIAAEIVSSDIAGHDDGDADLFAFGQS